MCRAYSTTCVWFPILSNPQLLPLSHFAQPHPLLTFFLWQISPQELVKMMEEMEKAIIKVPKCPYEKRNCHELQRRVWESTVRLLTTVSLDFHQSTEDQVSVALWCSTLSRHRPTKGFAGCNCHDKKKNAALLSLILGWCKTWLSDESE